jgi:hypothetical protein
MNAQCACSVGHKAESKARKNIKTEKINDHSRNKTQRERIKVRVCYTPAQ